MKIAVLSDTHGNYPLAIQMLDRFSKLDCIIHLGDTLQDADVIECALDVPVVKLAGNCDTSPKAPRELLLIINAMTFLLSHGDLYRVKTGMERICRKASSENAAVVLYGHTHVPAIQKQGKILLVNPGTLKEAAPQQSLAILTIQNGEVSAEIVPVSK
ncbi:MAG: metallophosphoesterase [Deltaproteobacteria bacterium]|nr:metallophosphoesterase [Deltaproteobacteria bacterium]